MAYSQYGKTCVKCGQANPAYNRNCTDCYGELVATPTCQGCGKILPVKINGLEMNYCPNCGAENPKKIPA